MNGETPHSNTSYVRADSEDVGPVPVPYDDDDDESTDFFRSGDSSDDSSPDRGHNSFFPSWNASSSSLARLNGINFLNCASFLTALVVWCVVALSGFNGMTDTHLEIIEEYQTLVTPTQWAYTIWIPIFVFDGVFAAAQMIPTFSARPAVQEGVRYFFFYACLAQIAWTFFFTFRLFILAFLAMIVLLFSLVSLLLSQFLAEHRERHSRREFWLLRFPFSLHCGWVFVTTAVSLNVDINHGAGEEVAAAIVSLALLLLVAFFFLAVHPSADFVIPSVIIWAFIAIGCELHDPKQRIRDQFDGAVIQGVRAASYWFALIISCLLVPRVIVKFCHHYFTIHVVSLDED